MIQDNKIVYVIGDSFTNGIELADYMLPNYPGEVSLNDQYNSNINELASNYILWKQQITKDNFNLHKFLRNNEELLRWSNQLSTIIDLPVINKSFCGADNFSIFVIAMKDLENLINSGHIIEKVIIQITSFDRISYINDKTVLENHFGYPVDTTRHLNDNYVMRSLNPAMHNQWNLITPVENKFLENHIMKLGDELQLTNSYHKIFLYNLLQLKLWKKSIKGITGQDPIIVDSLFIAYILQNKYMSVNLDEDIFLKDIFDDIFDNNLLSMSNICNLDEKCLTHGLHFTHHVHNKFAHMIADRYFK